MSDKVFPMHYQVGHNQGIHADSFITSLIKKYVQIYLKRPRIILAFELLILIGLVTIPIFTGMFAVSMNDGGEWLIRGNEQTSRSDALDEALSLLDDKTTDVSQQEREIQAENISPIIIFNSRSGNVFTEENIQQIQQVEEIYIKNNDYSTFCQLIYDNQGNSTCAPPLSALVSLLGDPTLDGYPNQIQNVDLKLNFMAQNIYQTGFFFDKEFSTENLKSKYTRSIIRLGMPLEDYSSSLSQIGEQKNLVYDKFLEKRDSELMDYLNMKAKPLSTRLSQIGKTPNGDVEVYWFHEKLQEVEWDNVVLMDFSWAILSFAFVFFYMSFHTRSLLVSSIGMLEVALAFPLAVLIYRGIFRIIYFDSINNLAMFLMLGIGADDVFVFTDAFRQSEFVPLYCETLESRLLYTMQRSAKAVFVTSFTTICAFLATAISDIMPIAAFGIFAALCIFILFVLNVLLMPLALIIWFNGKEAFCCGFSCRNQDALEDEFQMRDLAARERSVSQHKAIKMEDDKISRSKSSASALDTSENSTLGVLEKFFNGPYYNLFSKTYIFVVVAFIAILGVGLWQTSTLQPPSDTEQFLPETHSLTKVINAISNKGPFASSQEDPVTEVSMVWGIKGMNTKKINKWDVSDRGTLEWDENFSPTSESAQMFLLGVCNKTSEQACNAKGCNPKTLVRYGEASCFINEFNNWLLLNKGVQLPINSTLFLNYLSEFRNDPSMMEFSSDIGFIGEGAQKMLKFVRLRFSSTYTPPTSQSIVSKVVDTWENWMVKLNQDAPEGLKGGYQTGGYPWVWLQTQNALVRNAVLGMVLVFVLAFVVINVATHNIILGVLTVFTIGGIVSTVIGLGIRATMNWDLGVAESIAVVILVGFSMDYSLHLVDAYVESEEPRRLEKTRDALTKLGVSITAGAVTTILAGVSLYGATLVFFSKFAFLIVATILVSVVWSLVFLPSVLMLVGPQENWGSWMYLIDRLRNFRKGSV